MKWVRLFGILVVVSVGSNFFGSAISSAQGKEESVAVESLNFTTNIRFRYEYQDNFNQKFYGDNPKKGSSDDSFLLGRFQVGLDYQLDKNVPLYVSMINSDAWDVALPD
ncbi:MAG: hypothetical protein N3A64_03960, partial [Desulfobacterota bacterium]|nr:hypothetical protein [Thermodesulfobacteriota bacterium]